LTLNGHLGAVQQMAAPAPIVLMEFFSGGQNTLASFMAFRKISLGE
jgi:hypothetical protein